MAPHSGNLQVSGGRFGGITSIPLFHLSPSFLHSPPGSPFWPFTQQVLMECPQYKRLCSTHWENQKNKTA